MNAILGEFAKQIILVIFYIIVIIVAVRFGIVFAKKKNIKENTSTETAKQ